MPQKLNKAGKMQDYIPAGNGDPSGEYGTSKGTNKNFTTSEKKSSKANVITENKSVVVENKGKKTIKVRDEDVEVVDKMPDGFAVDDLLNKTSPYTPDGYLWVSDYETSSLKDRQYKLIEKDKWYNRFKEQDNKANVIDNDLTGKKEETLVDEKTQKEINDRISGWDNKMRYMMLSRMQSDVKYYLGAGGRSKKELWANDEKEHIAYMETLYNDLKEKPEWLSKKELENYKKELLKK